MVNMPVDVVCCTAVGHISCCSDVLGFQKQQHTSNTMFHAIEASLACRLCTGSAVVLVVLMNSAWSAGSPAKLSLQEAYESGCLNHKRICHSCVCVSSSWSVLFHCYHAPRCCIEGQRILQHPVQLSNPAAVTGQGITTVFMRGFAPEMGLW